MEPVTLMLLGAIIGAVLATVYPELKDVVAKDQAYDTLLSITRQATMIRGDKIWETSNNSIYWEKGEGGIEAEFMVTHEDDADYRQMRFVRNGYGGAIWVNDAVALGSDGIPEVTYTPELWVRIEPAAALDYVRKYAKRHAGSLAK